MAKPALDREGHGLNGMYLTVLGTSAESADGGETSAPVQPVKLKVTPPGSTSWNDKKD